MIRVGPGLGKGFHVARRLADEKPRASGNSARRSAASRLDDLAAPALLGLPLQNVAADAPIEADEFAVDREGGAEPRLANSGFQVDEPGGIIGGNGRAVMDAARYRGRRGWHWAIGGRQGGPTSICQWAVGKLARAALGGILGSRDSLAWRRGCPRSDCATGCCTTDGRQRRTRLGHFPNTNSMSCTLAYPKQPLGSNILFIFSDARAAPLPRRPGHLTSHKLPCRK